MKNKRIVSCPTCGQSVDWDACKYKPFCSQRCETRDLAAWANEKYSVPAQEYFPGNDLDGENDKDSIVYN